MNYKKLVPAIILPQLAGFLGSIFTITSTGSWYATINKPSFNPPSWVFGPAWITLYILMGISAYLIWQEVGKKKQAKTALNIFWVHLGFNAIWSIIFFGLEMPGLAFLNLVIIWIFIVIMLWKFFRINKWATYLLIPYLAWVSFAGVLNYFIWILN